MPIDKSTAAALLGWAAAHDNREVTESAAHAWAQALTIPGDQRTQITDGKTAISAHYGREHRWIMPADINRAVAAIRRDRVARMETPQPPQVLADNPRADHAWTKAYVTAIGDGHEPADAEQLACDHVGIPVPAPTITAPRPALPQLHPGACSCGCLTRPVRPEEGRAA